MAYDLVMGVLRQDIEAKSRQLHVKKVSVRTACLGKASGCQQRPGEPREGRVQGCQAVKSHPEASHVRWEKKLAE